MSITRILLGVMAAGSVFFLLTWVVELRTLRSMNRLEKLAAQIERERRKLEKPSLSAQIDQKASAWGLQGLWAPALAFIVVVYLVLAALFALLGFGDIFGTAVALPVSVAAGYGMLRAAKQRDEIRFRRQLLQAFGIIASQIEAGDSINRAVDKCVLVVEDPLRRELAEALAQLVGTTSLTTVLSPVAVKYPSRAMDLFLAALEVDELMGAKLAPTLRQAQASLERQFDLASEATAEISQARAEFLGITIVIALVGAGMFIAANGAAQNSYASPMGILLLLITVGNYGFGVYRTLRIFDKAKRGES